MRKIGKNGERLYSTVTVSVFQPGNKQRRKAIFRPPARNAFHSAGINDLLSRLADDIERAYPDQEYRLASLGPNVFNFVHVGARGV